MRAPLLMLLCLLAVPAVAADARIQRVDVLDRGVYTIATGSASAEGSTPTGEVTAVTTATNVESTDNIKAKVGLEFGLRYVVIGAPEGAEVPLDFVILYPEPGLKDPAESTPLRESRYQRKKKIGETVYLGYGFESEWEIVPGTWTFQIWDGDRELAEQTFTVSR